MNARMKRDDLLHEWEHFRSQGYSRTQFALRLGMSVGAFERALGRARAAGDERAVMGRAS